MYTRVTEGEAPKTFKGRDLLSADDVAKAKGFITPEARKAVAADLSYSYAGNRIADIPATELDDVMRGKWERGEVYTPRQFDDLFSMWERVDSARYATLPENEYEAIQAGRGSDAFDNAKADAVEDAREVAELDRLRRGLKYTISQQAEYIEYFDNHPYQTDEERAERVRKFNERRAFEEMREAIRNEPNDQKRAKLISENLDIV